MQKEDGFTDKGQSNQLISYMGLFNKLLPLIIGIMILTGGGVVWSYLDGLGFNTIFIEVFINKGMFFLVGLYLALLVYVLGIFLFVYVVNTIHLFEWLTAKLRYSGGGVWLFIIVFAFIIPVAVIYMFRLDVSLGMFVLLIAFPILMLVFLFKGEPKFLKNKKTEQKIAFVVLLIVGAIAILHCVSIKVNFGEMALQRNGFIQKSQQSAWYAFDTEYLERFNLNQQTGQSSLASPMENLKSRFVDQESMPLYERQLNVLFGYFLWNVGDTKVFCPEHVYPEKVNSNKKSNYKACLVIDKKYIQLIPSME